MPYTTQDIRNIALVGQAGAGKTLLTEALLAQSGAIRSKGSLARGTTVCDFDPQEKTLLHSLDAAICGFETQGKRVNVIDTPGYPDFLGRTLSALEAVETAVIVVSAVNGVEPMTQRMMDFAKARGLCRLIVVNKIDSREARTADVLAEPPCPSICRPRAARPSSTVSSSPKASRPIFLRSRARTRRSSTRWSRSTRS
jgi:elongation factor G